MRKFVNTVSTLALILVASNSFVREVRAEAGELQCATECRMTLGDAVGGRGIYRSCAVQIGSRNALKYPVKYDPFGISPGVYKDDCHCDNGNLCEEYKADLVRRSLRN